MKKQIIVLLLTLTSSILVQGQSRGIRVGYIDMEYILQNVPDYTEAKNQLEQKAQKWKQDLETKKNEITKLKESLSTERVLLTKELIDEREEEIKFQETELSDYQQKRFGPNGDMVVQKTLLVQPIQDQVFTAVQDIAEAKKYDFVFDKSSDLTMLFAAKRFDISDQVVRVITRSSKRTELTKKQQKEEEAKQRKEDQIDDNPGISDRQKILDEKKAARVKLLEDKKLASDERKKAAADARQKLLDDNNAKKNGTVSGKDKEEGKTSDTGTDKIEDTSKSDAAKANANDKLEARKKVIEDRKKASDDRKQKILDDREAAKKAKLDKTQKP
jgi:Skp family chaperone for outer membrane proteins